MFYVCVICMVSDRRGPLMELTGVLLQIWKRMTTLSQPCIKIKRLSDTTLLVCTDCQQLLETIHKFQCTMTVGANYLLSLHDTLSLGNQTNKNNKKVLFHPLPQLINQSDLWLPVANEEVVESTETCDDIESAEPVATNANTTKRPLILHRRPAVEKLSSQQVPETIGEYAVLIPNGGLRGWKPVHPSGAPVLEGPRATERSDATTQIRVLPVKGPHATDHSDATQNVSLMGRNDAKIQIRAPLLKVPPTERSDATTQITASLIKGPHAVERNDVTTQIRAPLLKGPPTERNNAKTQIRATLLKGTHAVPRKDVTIKIRASLLQEPHAKQLIDTITQIRAPLSKGPQVRGSINQSDALGLPEPAQCIRPAMLIAFKDKSNLREEAVACSSEFSKNSKIEEATPIPRDAKAEPTNVSALSEDKIKLNRQLFDALKATLQASLTEEFDIKYEPEPETGCESRPELGRKLEPELKRDSVAELGSEPDFGRDSDDPDSESTLSCQSDYEDPEYCPNIIFARAFDGVNGVSYDPRINGNGLDREGKAQDVQIHSHIVTNPPSEWPCTWECCQLQTLDEDRGSEASETADGPSEQVTRSKRKGYARFKCKLCGKGFPQCRILWEHYEREHVEPTVKCNLCRKEFRNETELKFHKIKHQIKVTAEFEEYAPHLCAACGLRFRGQLVLRQHLLTRRHAVRALWRFQCDICKRKFPDKKRIASHIQIEHLAKEAVKCPMCTATFESARSLRRHATQHILAQAQENIHANTQANGQARKRRRTHTNGEDKHRNGCEDTNSEEHKNTANGRRKKPRKTIHTKAKAYNKRKRQENAHTDINVQVKRTEKQTNRQRKTDKNSQMRKYTNRQDTHTYTLNGQESTQDQTHLNGQRNTQAHTNTWTDIQNGQINTESKITRDIQNGQLNTDKITHTNTCTDIQNGQINTESKKTRNAKGRVRKRRRKCPFTKRKRACTKPPAAQEPAVPKTSLFDMVSSFIL